jgi:hypothetical protein
MPKVINLGGRWPIKGERKSAERSGQSAEIQPTPTGAISVTIDSHSHQIKAKKYFTMGCINFGDMMSGKMQYLPAS